MSEDLTFFHDRFGLDENMLATALDAGDTDVLHEFMAEYENFFEHAKEDIDDLDDEETKQK